MKFVLVIIGLLSSFAVAREPYGIPLKKVSTTAIIAKMESNKIIVFDKEWSAMTYCNEDTVLNPEMLEAYSFRNNDYELVLLCPGSLDGVVNTVSVFSRSLPPLTKRVPPLSSSSRISDDVIAKTIQELTGRARTK